MMRNVVSNKDIDHTSQFWPYCDSKSTKGNDKTCNMTNTNSKKAIRNIRSYKSKIDLSNIKNGVTNSRSGLKWFYAKNSENGEKKGRVPRDIKTDSKPKALKSLKK